MNSTEGYPTPRGAAVSRQSLRRRGVSPFGRNIASWTSRKRRGIAQLAMKMTRTRMAVATVMLAGALTLAPFSRAKAQVVQDTLQKPKNEASAPEKKPLALVKPYPMLSGFSLLPNPAARFRLGTYVNPFVVFVPKSESACELRANTGLQANAIVGSTGVTVTAVGKDITAALLQKIGPVVVAAELSSKTGKPMFAVLYTIKHDDKMLVSAALMRDMGNGIWTLGGEGRFTLRSEWDITPSFKLSISDAKKVAGGLGLQVAHKSTRASLGSDGHIFNLDVQRVFEIDIGKKTLLLLPDVFISIGRNGLKEIDMGVVIVL